MSYAPIQTRWQSADLALQKGDESTAAGPLKPGGGALVAGRSSGSRAGQRWVCAAWLGLTGGLQTGTGWAGPPWLAVRPCGGCGRCGAAAPAELVLMCSADECT